MQHFVVLIFRLGFFPFFYCENSVTTTNLRHSLFLLIFFLSTFSLPFCTSLVHFVLFLFSCFRSTPFFTLPLPFLFLQERHFNIIIFYFLLFKTSTEFVISFLSLSLSYILKPLLSSSLFIKFLIFNLAEIY